MIDTSSIKVWLMALILCWVCASAEAQLTWKKHTIMEQGDCYTAVTLDANGDRRLDVIASFEQRVSLFLAPDWREFVLHRLQPEARGCIHSEVIDVDGDGDLDWAGAEAHGNPFWLENPGKDSLGKTVWQKRMIDTELTGIHCLVRGDIDNDGRDDLVINNFSPDKGLADSIAWFSIPEKPMSASNWQRHLFAQKDARGGSHYMGIGDIDGDGWKEIGVGAKGHPFKDGNWFGYWKNPGEACDKDKWKKVILAENQTGATNILPADVNGDGRVDWVATRGHGKGVLWFENPGWRLHDVDTDIECPHSLTIADHDQDGDIDIASCGFKSQWVRWYQNDGKGGFKIHSLDDNQQSYDLRSVDMDGDGDLDLLNAGRQSQNVVWYENPLKPSALASP